MGNRIVFFVLFIIIISGSCFAAEFKIIANRSVLADCVKGSDLKKIFLGKKTFWGNDEKIIPVLVDKKDIHNAFVRKIIKKIPYQFSIYWKRMIFTGRSKTLKILKDEQADLNYITVTKGAIGCISKNNKNTKNVKIIHVHVPYFKYIKLFMG